MRAAGITRFGGPGVLQIVERPVPEPGPGEVRIRVAAATVNPTDTVLRSGRHAAAPEGSPTPRGFSSLSRVWPGALICRGNSKELAKHEQSLIQR